MLNMYSIILQLDEQLISLFSIYITWVFFNGNFTHQIEFLQKQTKML